MFCIYCGREVPEGQVCPCRMTQGNNGEAGSGNTGYGSPYGQGPVNNQGPAYYQGPSYGQNPGYGGNQGYYQGYNQNTSGVSACYEPVKKILKSPIMAVMAVLYTVGCVIGHNLGVFQILMIVAMWITFASALKKEPMKTSGMSIVSGVYVAWTVILSVSFLIMSVLIGILLANPKILSVPYEMFAEFADLYFNINMPGTIALSQAVTIIILAVWVCWFIIEIVYFNLLRRSAGALKSVMTQTQPVHNVSAFAAVLMILGAFVSLASTALTVVHMSDLNGFINAVLNRYDIPVNFLFGVNYFWMAGGVLSCIARILGAVMLFRLHGAIKKSGEN